MQRNYPYVLPSTSTVLLASQNDFNQSNAGTTQTAMCVMITFLICSILVKFYQTFNLLKFHKIITQIMNIFRRVNLQDSLNEKIFYQDILLILKQPFLRFSFYEKCLNKKKILLEEELIKSSEKHAKKKHFNKNAKLNFYNVKKLPITKILIYMTILFTWTIVYYFFNYYFWISNNQNINNLIQINIFFINVYIYSTSIIGFNTMAIRERVVRNYDYEAVNDTYQQYFPRMNYLYSSLLKRFYLIGNITSLDLPQYTLDAKTSINSQDFDHLVDGDICQYLLTQNFLDDDELDFCRNSFHGSFTLGILSLVHNYIQQIRDFQIFTEFYNQNQTELLEKQIEAANY